MTYGDRTRSSASWVTASHPTSTRRWKHSAVCLQTQTNALARILHWTIRSLSCGFVGVAGGSVVDDCEALVSCCLTYLEDCSHGCCRETVACLDAVAGESAVACLAHSLGHHVLVAFDLACR